MRRTRLGGLCTVALVVSACGTPNPLGDAASDGTDAPRDATTDVTRLDNIAPADSSDAVRSDAIDSADAATGTDALDTEASDTSPDVGASDATDLSQDTPVDGFDGSTSDVTDETRDATVEPDGTASDSDDTLSSLEDAATDADDGSSGVDDVSDVMDVMDVVSSDASDASDVPAYDGPDPRLDPFNCCDSMWCQHFTEQRPSSAMGTTVLPIGAPSSPAPAPLPPPAFITGPASYGFSTQFYCDGMNCFAMTSGPRATWVAIGMICPSGTAPGSGPHAPNMCRTPGGDYMFWSTATSRWECQGTCTTRYLPPMVFATNPCSFGATDCCSGTFCYHYDSATGRTSVSGIQCPIDAAPIYIDAAFAATL